MQAYHSLTLQDVRRVVCERLSADTHESRAASVKVAENIGPMYGTLFGTTLGDEYTAADHWLAWAESRLYVLRLPGAKLSLFGDIAGFAAKTASGEVKMWALVYDESVALKLREHFIAS